MPLEFGTAGIRGIVGDTREFLNEAHAAQIFEAYAKYLNDKFKNTQNKCVVIGRDNRKKGKQFCILAANILSSYGIKIFYSQNMLPTPFISFLIKEKQALGGINITASHNPKEYNGIKIYNNHAFQMLPKEIKELKLYFDDYSKYEKYINRNLKLNINPNILNIEEIDYQKYINGLHKLINNKEINNLKIAYSPLHGTGYYFAKQIFQKMKLNVVYEKNEIIEDEEFSFVENPNPELEVAYKNTLKLSQEEQADLILITDPDSDRLGIAYQNEDKAYQYINGNENAILITDYLLNNKKLDNQYQYYLIYSFVSTSLPSQMCLKNNISSLITETGFKWIGEKISNFNQDEKLFFAFEESYGSLSDDYLSLDKDALQAMTIIIAIAAEAKKENLNLGQKLEKIYQKYGFMEAKSFSFALENQNQLAQLKSQFKSINFENATLLDYSQGINDIEPNDMLAYQFCNSLNWVSLRPSGTEPKFKIYIHVVEKTKELAQQKFNELFIKIKNSLKI